MKYCTIDTSGTRFSRIAYGTTYIGTVIDTHTSLRLLERFVELGGTTIDTARVYGQNATGQLSVSEQLIGEFLRSSGMRNQLAIVTKGAHPDIPTKRGRLSRNDLQQDLKQSLDALGCSHIDLYFLHRDDPTIPVEEVVDMVDDVCDPRLVTSVGVSNWSIPRIERARAYAEANGKRPFIASEIQWSLASCTPESYGDTTVVCADNQIVNWHESQQFPLFAFSSQAKGLFSKSIAHGRQALNKKIRNRFLTPENWQRVERAGLLAQQLGTTVASVVLSYITSSSFPSIAIIGSSTIEQLEDSLENCDLVLSEEQRSFLLSGM